MSHILSLYLAMRIANDTDYDLPASDLKYMCALRNMTTALRTLSKDERDLYYQNLRDKALVSSLRDLFDHPQC